MRAREDGKEKAGFASFLCPSSVTRVSLAFRARVWGGGRIYPLQSFHRKLKKLVRSACLPGGGAVLRISSDGDEEEAGFIHWKISTAKNWTSRSAVSSPLPPTPHQPICFNALWNKHVDPGGLDFKLRGWSNGGKNQNPPKISRASNKKPKKSLEQKLIQKYFHA